MTVHGVALLLIYILIGYCIGFMRGSMFTKKDYIQIIKILYEDEEVRRAYATVLQKMEEN